MALDQFNKAEDAYSIALDLEPSIRRSKPFKVFLTFRALFEKYFHLLIDLY